MDTFFRVLGTEMGCWILCLEIVGLKPQNKLKRLRLLWILWIILKVKKST